MPESAPSTPHEDRQELGRRQAALVRAIQAGDPPPEGIDVSKLTVAARSLLQKRMHSVQKTWPGVIDSSEPFETLFERYAADHPTPSCTGIDGYEFALWLKSKGTLSDAGRIAMARFKVSRGGMPRPVWLTQTRSVGVVYRWRGTVRVRRFHILPPRE